MVPDPRSEDKFARTTVVGQPRLQARMGGVLDGIKVLDLSWGVAGPMTGMLLTDHGADVTRIERPQGDPFPNLLGYKVWHRGKKNAVLDLKDESDAELFRRLAADADVVIESMRPGKTKALGIDYDALAELNPSLIYCSITGYGEKKDDRPGYDALVAASSGLQYEQRGWPEGALNHLAGREDPFADTADIDPDWVQGANRDGPLHLASPWPSLGAFFSASLGIAAALFSRARTGQGQKVSASLLQGAMVCGTGVWQRVEHIDREGFDTWIMCSKSPKGHFQCADGRWIHNWVPNPRFIMEASKGSSLNATPDLTVQNDPDRFGMGPEELLVMAHYQPMLADAVRKFTAPEWVEAAGVAGMTMQECRSIEESLTDPLLLDDGCVTTVDDPELGPINQVGTTYRLETSAGVAAEATRATGADTDAVKSLAAALPPARNAAQAVKPASDGPLKGVRVLDLGLAVAGPFGCQLLSDLGADVIKINSLWDMYWHRGHVAYVANRGKRSIALNLKKPRAMQVLKELIATADVIQHNMRYGAVERLGIDYESLKEAHPRLIYCHSRGFEKGPRMNLPGNDQTGACLAGIQHEDGAVSAGGHPIWSLTSLGDTGNGFLAAIGICNALMEREKTGKGQFVDTSIINACLLNTSYAVAKPDGSAVDRPRLNADQTGFGDYYRLYRTVDDKWIQVAAIADEHKRAFDAFVGEDKESAIAGRRAQDVLKGLAVAGVPTALSDAEASMILFDNAEYKKRRWTVEFDHAHVGKVEQVGASYGLSHTPISMSRPPLIVGDHTAELLRELGYCEEDIDELARDVSIYCDPPREGQQTLESPWAT